MNKLILISIVIFFAICSKSWADTSWLTQNNITAYEVIVLITPVLIFFVLINKINKLRLIIATLISAGCAYIFLKADFGGANYFFLLPIYVALNAWIYDYYDLKYYDSLNKEKEEIKKKKETKIKQLKEEEYTYNQKLINNAENSDHKAAIELSKKHKDNNVEAYYWNLVAEASGSREAISNKANILNEMSDLQINIAQEKFKKWLNDKIGMTLSNIYAPLKTQASFGGCVYIMTCDKWTEDGLVKIGKSNNVQRRLNEAQKEVQGTYSPNPPTIKLYHDQFSRYYNELEKHIHLKLQDRRFKSDTSTATEFFRLTPEEAKAELDIAIR